MPDKGGQNHKIKIKIKYKKVTTQCYASKPQTEWHTESVRYKKLQECCLTPHKTLPETRLSMKLITAAHNAQGKSNHEMQYTYYDKAGGGGGGGRCVCAWVSACMRGGVFGEKGMQKGWWRERTVGKRDAGRGIWGGDCGKKDAGWGLWTKGCQDKDEGRGLGGRVEKGWQDGMRGGDCEERDGWGDCGDKDVGEGHEGWRKGCRERDEGRGLWGKGCVRGLWG